MKKMVLLLAVLLIGVGRPTAVPAAESTPQALYLQAGKEERSGSQAKARELYEQIIDRYPESDFAVKANDRLLTMPPAGKKAEAPQPLEQLFTPPQPKPLPTDPRLRQAVEAARTKEKAEVTYREEYSRLWRVAEARDGRKQIRSRQSDYEAQWREGAAARVQEEFGASLAELTQRLERSCRDLGVRGECSEESLLSISRPAEQ